MEAGEVKELPIIIKTDVGGSAEVLTETLQKLSNEKVKVRVIHSGVGAINECDVLLASASNAIIIGFNVRPERKPQATGRAGEGGHPPAHHHLQPDRRDEEGHVRPARAGVQGSLPRQGRGARNLPHHARSAAVAGCQVTGRHDHRATAKCRVLRDNVVVHTGKIGSLRRFKDDVSEVKSGMECGITLANFSRCQAGRHHRSVRHRTRRRPRYSLPDAMAAIGVLTLELRLEDSHSLKEKRHVVKESEGPPAA